MDKTIYEHADEYDQNNKFASSQFEAASMKQSYETYLTALKLLKTEFDSIQHQKALDPSRFSSISNIILSSIDQKCILNPVFFYNDNDDLIVHSLNVAILSSLVGKTLGMGTNDLASLCVGSLLHDVGVVFYQSYPFSESFYKDGFITDSNHVELAVDFIDRNAFSNGVFQVIEEHHEFMDSSGFPKGLSSHEISVFGKISSLVNCFLRISAFGQKEDVGNSVEAVQYIMDTTPRYFCNDLVKVLIDIVGLYPVGTLVILSSGELAIVYRQNCGAPSSPHLLIISDFEKKKTPPKIMNILHQPKTNFIDQVRVLYPLNSVEYGIQSLDAVHQYFQL